MFQDFQGVFLIDIEAGFDDLGVEVVGPLFDDSPTLDAADELFGVVGLKIDDLLDDDEFVEEIGLANGAGDPVEKEELLAGEIAIGGNEAMDEVVPNLDRHLIGEKKPLPREIVIELAGRRFGG